MDIVVSLKSAVEAEPLVKAKLKVRPAGEIIPLGCKIKILNVDKVEQPGLRLFSGTVYKDKEWGTMFTVDSGANGYQTIRIIT